jgi:hypothetical protein
VSRPGQFEDQNSERAPEQVKKSALGRDDDARRAREPIRHTHRFKAAVVAKQLAPPLRQWLELLAQLLLKLLGVALVVANLQVLLRGVLELDVLIVNQVLRVQLDLLTCSVQRIKVMCGVPAATSLDVCT